MYLHSFTYIHLYHMQGILHYSAYVAIYSYVYTYNRYFISFATLKPNVNHAIAT